MYLRDLAVYASGAARLPDGATARQFNESTHTPVEAYLALLPRRTVVLDDLAKVNVAVGPVERQRYFAALNIATIYWPWFNFESYCAWTRDKQQRRIAEVLHKALLHIARRTGSPTHWYEDAYGAFLQQRFPLPEISDFELRRRWGLLTPEEKRCSDKAKWRRVH
jgi:hypothetical protein